MSQYRKADFIYGEVLALWSVLLNHIAATSSTEHLEYLIQTIKRGKIRGHEGEGEVRQGLDQGYDMALETLKAVLEQRQGVELDTETVP